MTSSEPSILSRHSWFDSCRQVFWIAVREHTSYVFRPLGLFLIAGFLAVSGWYFAEKMAVEATTRMMRSLFRFLEHLTIFVVPLLAMQTIAGEEQSGTLETLLTSPVGETGIVLGKFIGCILFYGVMLAGTILHTAILHHYGSIDPMPVVTGYAGLLLSGALFLSLGMFMSSLFERPLLAAMFTFLILLVLRMMPTLTMSMEPGRIRELLTYINYRPHLSPFRRGVIDSRDLVYFLTATPLMLGCTVFSVHSRRWL